MRAALLLAFTASCSYPQFAFAPDTSAIDSAVIDTSTLDTAIPETSIADTAVPEADAAPAPRIWLFDFGSSDTTTPGYNNVDQSKATGGSLNNLVDSTGATTMLSLRISSTDRFYTNGANTAGTTTPASSIPFAPSATRDSIFGATMPYMGEAAPKAVVEIAGLDASRTYDLDLFASRMGGTGVLESSYTVGGVTRTLDANDNTSKMAQLTSLRPSAMGSLNLTITAGPMNTSPYGFFYVGAMRLTERVP